MAAVAVSSQVEKTIVDPQGPSAGWMAFPLARPLEGGYRGSVGHPDGRNEECVGHIHPSAREAIRCARAHALLLNGFRVAPLPRDDIPF